MLEEEPSEVVWNATRLGEAKSDYVQGRGMGKPGGGN